MQINVMCTKTMLGELAMKPIALWDCVVVQNFVKILWLKAPIWYGIFATARLGAMRLILKKILLHGAKVILMVKFVPVR